MKNSVGQILVFSAIIASAIGFFSPSISSASTNPLQRECRLAGGAFDSFKLGTDDFPICRFNGVIIDALTLLQNVNTPRVVTAAATVIWNDVTSADCTAVGASDYTLPTGEAMCFFGDDSKLSLQTLTAGLSNPDRLRLKDSLTTR